MTALASTAAARHDVLVAFGTLLFLAGAGLLVGCLVVAAILHGRRDPSPLPSKPAAVTPEPLHTPQPPVHDITTKPAFRPDGAHHVLAALVERDAPTEYLPRHGGARCY